MSVDRAVLERKQNSATASESIFYIMLIPVASILVANRIALSIKVVRNGDILSLTTPHKASLRNTQRITLIMSNNYKGGRGNHE